MKLPDTIRALAVVLALCAATANAQAQNQDSQSASPASPLPSVSSGGGGGNKAPVGAARGVSPASDPQPYDPAQVLPDNNTLSGAQQFGLGSLEHARNIFDPSISVSELGQTQPGTTGQSTLASVSILNGGLSFDRTWSTYHMTAAYVGGETFYAGGTPTLGPNSSQGPFQELTFSQQIEWGRWHILLRDDFAASPGATFAGTGTGGPGLISEFSSVLGSSLSSLGQAFVPSETIETGNATRYRNSALGQTEYSFSRRSAITFSGSYGLLDFPGAGFVSSHMLNAQAGYDYLLDPMDSIAVLGSYGKIDYTGTSGSTSLAGNSTSDYTAALAFGRKITGRLAFQVAAGPQRIRVERTASNFDLWFTSVNTALSYQRRRGGISLSYTRGLGAGSGVYLGSTANTFSGSGHYDFTRFWTGSVNGGYALNNSIAPAGVATTSFNNVFFGANLGRRIGRHVQINFNYGLQRQSTPAACPVASCGVTGIQQTFGMSVNWHLLPTE